MGRNAEYWKKLEMPHVKHGQHLCYMENMGILTKYLSQYKQLVKDPQYVCKKCGRAAKSKLNLCKPDKL